MQKLNFDVLEVIKKKRDEIYNKIRDAYKSSLNNTQLGWRYGVEIDNNNVWEYY